MSVSKIDTTTGELISNEKSNQNKDFVMMYRRYINQIAELGSKDANALKVLLFLVKNMDNRNALAVTFKTISELIHMTRQTVSNKIKYLENNGWIYIYKIGRENIYVINPDVVWTSYDSEKKYCQFDAKVILSCNDNWDLLRKNIQNVRHIEKDVFKMFNS